MTSYKNKFNRWYKWVTRDDYFVWEWELIYTENVDWTKDGYWIGLWPKINNLFELNSWEEVIGLFSDTEANDDELFILTTNGRLLYFSSLILTQSHNFWKEIINTHQVDNYIYFITESSFTYTLERIDFNSFRTAGWEYIEQVDNQVFVSPTWCQMLDVWWSLYIWNSTGVRQYSNAWWSPLPPITNYYSLTSWVPRWLSVATTNFKVYDGNKSIVLWKTWDTNNSGVVPINVYWKTYSNSVKDFIITSKGALYEQNWYNFTELISPKTSNYLDDSAGQTKMKLNYIKQKQITFAEKDMYVIWANDSVPWIWKYWEVRKWVGKWWYKIITQWRGDINIDNIFSVFYREATNRLYFSYQEWVNYYFDYVELDWARASSWFFITPINNWNNLEEKTIKEIKIVARDITWNNNIKIYAREDDKTDWQLITTRTNVKRKETINFDEIQLDSFNDVQFKVEINNPEWLNPIINWFLSEFDINEE